MKKNAKKAVKPAKKPAVKAKKTTAKKSRPSKAKVVKVKLAGGKAVVAPLSPKIIQNGIARPRPSYTDGRPKVTFRVWEICDTLAAKNFHEAKKKKKTAEPPTRQQVLKACNDAGGITYSVFSAQFYRWRKFNGLFGRMTKSGEVAAVTGGPKRGAQAEKPAAVKPKPPATKKPAPKGKKPAAKPAIPTKAAQPELSLETPAAPAASSVLPFPVPAAAPAGN